jgi:hypothetical protein
MESRGQSGLMDSAIDELRFEAPNSAPRFGGHVATATRSQEIRRESVSAAWQPTHPRAYAISTSSAPNAHVSSGIHPVGQKLARAEGRIAFTGCCSAV